MISHCTELGIISMPVNDGKQVWFFQNVVRVAMSFPRRCCLIADGASLIASEEFFEEIEELCPVSSCRLSQ